MKEKGYTFSWLADQIGMSVPGVKKIFQKDDIGLERFKQICRILEVDAADLIKKDSRHGLKIKSLSSDADAYLSKDQRALHLYWLLVIERLTLTEAMQNLKLAKEESYKYLRQLDRFGLVKWMEGDEVAVPDEAPFVFDYSVSCAVDFARNQAIGLVNEAFEAKPTKQSHLSVRYVSLPPEKVLEFCNQLSEMADEISRKYPHLGRGHSKSKGLVPSQFVFCLRPGEAQLGSKAKGR
jgi:DNA-binding Xre family transcriptional regulator